MALPCTLSVQWHSVGWLLCTVRLLQGKGESVSQSPAVCLNISNSTNYIKWKRLFFNQQLNCSERGSVFYNLNTFSPAPDGVTSATTGERGFWRLSRPQKHPLNFVGQSFRLDPTYQNLISCDWLNICSVPDLFLQKWGKRQCNFYRKELLKASFMGK